MTFQTMINISDSSVNPLNGLLRVKMVDFRLFPSFFIKQMLELVRLIYYDISDNNLSLFPSFLKSKIVHI